MAPIVNSENSKEAEASEVALIFLPEVEGIDQTLKVGIDLALKEIEVATKVTLEGSLEVAEAGLMLLASTTTIESNFHPEDLKMMRGVVKFNKDHSEAVVASEEVISKTEEAVECTPEEAASEAVVEEKAGLPDETARESSEKDRQRMRRSQNPEKVRGDILTSQVRGHPYMTSHRFIKFLNRLCYTKINGKTVFYFQLYTKRHTSVNHPPPS